MGRAVARQGAALVNGHGLAPQLHGLAWHWSQDRERERADAEAQVRSSVTGQFLTVWDALQASLPLTNTHLSIFWQFNSIRFFCFLTIKPVNKVLGCLFVCVFFGGGGGGCFGLCVVVVFGGVTLLFSFHVYKIKHLPHSKCLPPYPLPALPASPPPPQSNQWSLVQSMCHCNVFKLCCMKLVSYKHFKRESVEQLRGWLKNRKLK